MTQSPIQSRGQAPATPRTIDQNSEQLAGLRQTLEDLLAEAKRCGASAAEAAVTNSNGLEISVRLGEVETVEHTRDRGLGITVYFGHRTGSASTSDFSPEAVRDAVQRACNLARHTQEDPCAGLADAALMASQVLDLDLNHPWALSVDDATALAIACEDAARATDPRIVNSEGASLSTHSGLKIYGNSHGFIGGYPSTRHGMSCAVVASQDDSMQRDYWWTSARAANELQAATEVGREAARRTVARLGGRRLGTRKAPVLFRADLASSLLRALAGAINGGNLYRKSSFLLDQLGKRIFPPWVEIFEQPHLPRGLASAPFDGDGLATQAKHFVSGGELKSYVLDHYSACRLGLTSTANAGGPRNLAITMGELDRKAMLRELGTGLFVTELMGQGVNMVTGDYSRGASGFWVENGEIQHPVEEVTIAGNLKTMFENLVAVGNDCDYPGSTRTGSWLVERMTIAGD
ncbi:metalloprotease PmbA [Thiorhodovibrio frisius]|uniref:Putative Zn-dependent protease-like protein n=1 Tax=Thiorhodovibrio frisius TaxID=631362 RepID=H8Z2Y0_9GAMM|nr:metalloprotease PmbA [Thiorhodovibrio frisius]EIC22752.1 putative Zn-dependent protease-like protein [Thiorhodovibrio frisius]WPL22509.1 peptidase PmbA [Thiorhodovibrio frisius]